MDSQDGSIYIPDQSRLPSQGKAISTRPGSGLLIGVNLKKDPTILQAAYNDGDGSPQP